MSEQAVHAEVAFSVRQALARVDRRISQSETLSLDTSLVDDLGLDSVRLLALTLELEDALHIAEFPMQEWSDEQIGRAQPRFTLGSLIALCVRQLGRS